MTKKQIKAIKEFQLNQRWSDEKLNFFLLDYMEHNLFVGYALMRNENPLTYIKQRAKRIKQILKLNLYINNTK